MKRLLSIILLLLPIISFAQSETSHLNEKNLNGIEIQVKQSDNKFPRTFQITINHQNNLISKTDSLYDGIIKKSWIKDLDKDKNPEIIVFTQTAGSSSAGTIHFYEFTYFSLKSSEFPNLSSNLQSKYQGHDSFKIEENQLIREFSLYNESDANCCPSGGTASISYNFINNELTETGYNNEVKNQGANSNRKLITLTIQSAEGLPKMDAFSHTDAWIEVYLGEEKINTTKKVQDASSPFFDEVISIRNYQNEPISFVLYDRDATKNEYIGQSTIQKPQSGSYPILMKKENGDIVKQGELVVNFNE